MEKSPQKSSAKPLAAKPPREKGTPRKKGDIATPKEYESAQAEEKEYAIADGQCRGLQMVVTPLGSKLWEFRYRHNGQRRKLTILGGYPRVSVAAARTKGKEWSDLLGQGLDPAEHEKAKKAKALALREGNKNTFEVVACDWLNFYTRTKPLAEISRKHIQSRFDRDVFPAIGSHQIEAVTGTDIERVIDRIAAEGLIDKAHRVLWQCRGVFMFAIEKGLAQTDPTFNKQKRLPPLQGGNHAALTDPEQVGKLLRDIDACSSGISTRYALRIIPLVFTRPTELQLAQWSEIDLERALWSIPAERMKGPIAKRRSHLVPLSRQVVTLLKSLREENEDSEYVFPSPQNARCAISNMAMLKALRAMGYTPEEQSIHGFRAIARTLLDERLRFPFSVIETQLAHTVKDSNGTAYNRTQHLDARKDMMQAWADYLDTLKG